MSLQAFSFFRTAFLFVAIGTGFLAGCSMQQPHHPSSSPTRYSPPLPAPASTPPPAPSAPLIAASYNTSAAWPASAPQIYAQSAILIDARSGRVLFQKNADQRRQVASTQKLLTALIIATRENLDGSVTIQAPDTRVEPSKLGLRAGETYSRRNLLHALMVKSSNDATAALARDHAGSEQAFAAEMTLMARSIGATNSNFANAHGLPAAQYSTARDIARIAMLAYRNPDLRRMMLSRSLVFRLNSGRYTTLQATNKLLWRSPVFTGMKTGYTIAAGRCFVASANISGREMIFVQLGSKTSHIFDDAERMLRWGAAQ